MLLVVGDKVGTAIAADRNRQAAIRDQAIGDDRAIVADDDAGAVFDGLPWRWSRQRPRRKCIEGARHRDHHRLDGVFHGLVVEDRHDADFIALEGAAHVKLVQPLESRQHEEVGLHHGVVDPASCRPLLLHLGELCRARARLLATAELHLHRPARRGPFRAAGIGHLLRYQLAGNAEPRAAGRLHHDLPADALLLAARSLCECGALLRIERPGRLAALGLLIFLDGVDHALADVTGDGAVILADPGEVGLERQPFRLRHGIRRFRRRLQRRADRHGLDRLRLGAGDLWRCHLGVRARGRREHQCCRKHRSHDKSSRPIERDGIEAHLVGRDQSQGGSGGNGGRNATPSSLILRSRASGVSKDEGPGGTSWFTRRCEASFGDAPSIC